MSGSSKPKGAALIVAASILLAMAGSAAGQEVPDATSRNRVSGTSPLPASWDLESGRNLLWVAELGTEAYGGPSPGGGLVLVGTNNERPRRAEETGDRGVVMAFDVADGELVWQATHDKLASGAANDWPLQGVCSTPAVADGRVYYVSNRGELVSRELATGRQIWRLDMPERFGVHPTHMSASSPLVAGGRVFVHTGNGIDESGRVPAPEAPSFAAVDAADGSVLWTDAAPGGRLLEGQWSSPSFAVVGDRKQVLFPGGDGWLYSFDPATGEELWRFDGNAHRPEDGETRDAFVAAAVVSGERVFIGMGRDPEAGSAPGLLLAIEATGSGDVTRSGLAWSFRHRNFGRTISTVAVDRGVVYAADVNGFLHALDEESGALLWTYDALAAIWGSPLVADGKVYLGDDDGDLAVLEAGRRLQVLAEIPMGSSILASPAAADGVLYVATRRQLFALSQRQP